MKLLTANGQRLAGGTRVIETVLAFTQEKNGMRQKEKKFCDAEFYEADIQVDAILSYPWLVQNKIGVLPHRRALVTDLPDFVLLYGLGENKSKYFQDAGWVNGVKVVTKGATEEKQAGKVTPVVQSKASKKRAKRREKKVFDMSRKIGEMPSEVYTKMDLRLPSTGAFDEGKRLGLHERVLVGKQLAKVQPTIACVNEMFVATEKQFAEVERIENYGSKLLMNIVALFFATNYHPTLVHEVGMGLRIYH